MRPSPTRGSTSFSKPGGRAMRSGAAGQSGLAGRDRIPAQAPGRTTVGPSHEVHRSYGSFSYQAQSSKSRGASERGSSGTPASFARASASVSPTCAANRARRRLLRSARHGGAKGSGRARVRTSGRGSHAVPLPPTPPVFSSTRWPTYGPHRLQAAFHGNV
jgi:hypothetical protein